VSNEGLYAARIKNSVFEGLPTMNKLYLVLMALCFCTSFVFAQSRESQLSGYSASVFVGINHVEPYSFTSKVLYPGEKGKSHFKNGIFYQLQLGKEVFKIWEIQFEMEYQSNDEDYSELANTIIQKTGNWKAISSLVSLEVHPWKFFGVTPFFGVGTGISRTVAKEAVPNTAYFIDDTSVEFLLQASVGIGTRISRNTSLELKYEYNDDGDVNHANTSSVQPRAFKNHVFALGVAYHFSKKR